MNMFLNHCLLFVLFILAVRVNSQTCRGMSQYGQCSTNNDCGCLLLTISDDSGICGFLQINCSRLEPCEIPDDYCKNLGHVCVHHPRCHHAPVYYPLSMIDQRLCPPKTKITMDNPTTVTTIFQVPTPSLSPKPKVNICSTATWAQHGITIIGRNSHEGPSVDLGFAQGMFIDENQTIYIADTENHRVIKWKQDALSVEIITDGNDKENINISESNKPFDVVVDKNGTIYIAYMYINQVQKWIQGADRGETMINTHSPLSIAIDNEESIYVSSMSSSKLKKYRKGVTNGQVLMSGEVGPFPLTVDRHRSVYMVDMYHDRVFKIDEGRRNISVVVGGSEHNGTHHLSRPHSIAVDESSALYITEWDNHRITRWLPGSTDGIVIVGDRGPGSRSDQLHNPTDLGFDNEGNLYVVDGMNGRIQKYLIDNSSCQ